MNDKLEEVARAICLAGEVPDDVRKDCEVLCLMCLDESRAAIESMHPPTDEMVWAVCGANAEAVTRESCFHCPATVDVEPYGEGTQACRAIAENQIQVLIDAALEDKLEGDDFNYPERFP